MSRFSRHESSPEPKKVIRLECARFEEALSEGVLDAQAKAHRDTCLNCQRFAKEMERVSERIALATGPIAPRKDLESSILQRADWLDGHVTNVDGGAVNVRHKQTSLWVGVAVLAACFAMLIWAGALKDNASFNPLPKLVSLPANFLETVKSEVPLPMADSQSQTSKSMHPTPHEKPAAVVPAATVVPEPRIDIAGEIKRILLDGISANSECPKHTAKTIRVTVTVLPDGKVTDRQVISSGDMKQAHQCVTLALDRLLLPPTSMMQTITLDILW